MDMFTPTLPRAGAPTPWPAAPHRGLLVTVLRDAAYLGAVLVLSLLGFTIWTTAVSVGGVFALLIVGVVIAPAAVSAVRLVAAVDRALAGWYLDRRLRGGYRQVRPGAGMWERLRTVGRDRRTWRDLAWTIGNSIAGFAAALVTITITLVIAAYVTCPLWWWAVPDAHHEYAVLNLGAYTVTSTGLALLTSAIGLVLAPLALSLNHAVAERHARTAARWLGDR